MRTLFHLLDRTLQSGQDAVLVSIVASSGSTPRGAGAHMLVTRQGRLCGTIGGGAVEYRSEQMAVETLSLRRSRLEFFRLEKNDVLDLGMICGGDVYVYFHYIPADDVAVTALCRQVEALFARGEECWLISDVTPGSHTALSVYGKKSGLYGPGIPEEALPCPGSQDGCVTVGERSYFRESLLRGGRVYIFGGGHVAQALVPALAAVDFRCVVLEDREEFCRPELFPGVEETRLIDNSRVAEYVTIEEQDYVAVMTRGHSFDLEIQAQVLKTPARYIGVIGSRKKTARVFAALREYGFTDADLERITTPIGLDIGAETPAEIAVSITAQLIAARAGAYPSAAPSIRKD